MDGRYWQIVSEVYEDPQVTDDIERTRGQCPPGMVEVQGKMKLDPSPFVHSRARIERMQLDACVDWIQRRWPHRCREFDRDRWLAASAELATRPMHFCIDRFEFPNVRGQYPAIAVTWFEAGRLCKEQGKRLCTEDEWTFACEGEEALPYPYGYLRDAERCVIDQVPRRLSRWARFHSRSERTRTELDRLWQGEPSGRRPGCRSPFGVYDMTGNVDEWTRSVHERERWPSILKGGYWGPMVNRCRASTRIHNEWFAYYQLGFRCCKDLPAPAGGAARR